MFTAFERMVAWRYLRARRGERFVSITAAFSLLGIALGVAALIIVLAVMNGFRQDLIGRIIGLNGHLTVAPASGRALPDWQALAERLGGLPGVEQAAPIVEGQVLLTGEGGGAAAGLVRGIAPEDLRDRPVIARGIRRGSLEQFGEDDTVVVGLRLAARMGLRLQDRLTLVLPQARGGDFSAAPRQRSLRVVAMFEIGMPEYDNRNLFVPLAAAQALFGLEGAASQIEIMVADPSQVAPVTAEVRQALAGRPLRVTDWQGANSSVYAAVVVERNVMFLILTLIVLVAAFNIISSLTMLVKDKGRDIAILRTMGAGSSAVLRIFLLCGATVGCGGTLIGFLLGLGIALNFDTLRAGMLALQGTPLFRPELLYLTQLPAVVDWREVAQVVGMGLGLSLLATLYPSWRAARIDPAQALRNG
ncbi:lipoprotein-releasing ABC transporter permease subunit [Paracraurococcus ruber]|uniref:Lipoprotein-releasing system transmembrane subunit LolC n=1 Tax=Paracraurococcus ruber TaxID=77675 RepID=A0ABS1CQN0_9PROT|nr:lipoprotein-releasing ABC transporter permease subunit [Paracraurococcus ruber]MBK1656723.1 lipoprotein-releasing system transmembrane subunit LolC [Paracraurococcus ruber]TDG31988.1 lipoprotein-releasing ABC transporter permease subunit [Paracraurococcus ruber]